MHETHETSLSALDHASENSKNCDELARDYIAIEKAIEEEKIDSFKILFNESVILGTKLINKTQFERLMQKAKAMEDKVPEFIEHLNKFKGSGIYELLQLQWGRNGNKNEAWNVFDPNVYWKQSHESIRGARGNNHGIVFAKNWIMKLLIYLIQKPSDAKMSVENTEYVGFDDFVISDTSHTYCFQFKSKANDTDGLQYGELLYLELESQKNTKLSNNRKVQNNTNSAISKNEGIKYPGKRMYRDFNEGNKNKITRECKHYSAINYFGKFCEGPMNNGVKNSVLILFTNRKLDDALVSNILDKVETMPSEILDKDLFKNRVYKLRASTVEKHTGKFRQVFDNLKSTLKVKTTVNFESTLKLFEENFYICADQENDYNQLMNEVKDAIETMYGNQYKHELFNWFFTHFESWYRTSDNEDKRNEGVVIPTRKLIKYFDKLQCFYN